MYMNTLIVNSIMIFNIFQNLQISNFSDVFLRKGNFTNGAQLINFKSGKIHKSILSQKDIFRDFCWGTSVHSYRLEIDLKKPVFGNLDNAFF